MTSSFGIILSEYEVFYSQSQLMTVYCVLCRFLPMIRIKMWDRLTNIPGTSYCLRNSLSLNNWQIYNL